MRFKMMLAVATAAVLATPALADDSQAKPEKKICRRQEVTGSILGAKAICHTKTEWQKIDEANATGANNQLERDRQLRNSSVENTRNN